MCGITGYVGEGNLDVLQKMTGTLFHRGPDHLGQEIVGDVGFGHARLSILDLSLSGNQPMWNKDRTVMIVFNGEIYNFKDLKKGSDYKTKTDTEVILSVYDEYGERVFEKIHGMFAIAIYDTKKKKLFLARDRVGKKPLYWGIHENTFLFGSELKALIAHPQFKKEIDIFSLNKYFLYEYIPTPCSIFKNTYKLEPGTYLVWDGNRVEKRVYWEPSFKISSSTFEESLVRLDTLFSRAVQDRLVADVPVGIFLSGGIDSSAIAYYASKYSRIKTFSIGFKEPSFDESKYARQIAEHLHTDHRESFVSARDCLESIPKIFDLLDEPIADASIVPTYLLSQFTKGYVTVALGGDGGDELFCGYDTFVAEKIATIYEKTPFF